MMSRATTRWMLSGALGFGLVTAAAAQTTPVVPQPKDPNMPAQSNTPPEKIAPRPDATGTLSDKLEKTDGVIKPPGDAVGRVITPPDPNPGSGMVIPPNGTLGSARPNVEPK